jgi:metal-sulfur cluster biosynthetic enzyme
MSSAVENLNPKIHKKSERRVVTISEKDENAIDEIDAQEIFDMIRDINDPEHPLTLEDLNVVSEERIQVDNENNLIKIEFTPTIPHCSMATLIGLSIRVQLLRSVPERFKVDVQISPGSHASETAINKQLADKERVAAALENAHLIEVVNQCLAIKGY